MLLEHAKELKENFQRWIHAIMERKDIAGMHHQSLYDAPPPRPPPAMMTKTTTRKKEDLQRRDQECRQQNSAPKGAFNENNNQGGGVGLLSLPRFMFLKLLPTIDKIAWDPRLKTFVMYFLCVLFMETKIAIVGVKQISPDEKRFLTPEMYSVYVKNMLMTFVPLQFAIDLTFLSLGVRKRIGARGELEYDTEYEEKVYFWRQMIKTFLRHPQVTLALAGLYGPVSHEFSSVQFGAIVFMPLIIGKYSISRYSSLKYSFFYSIMATVYAFLFQFSAPAVREMWFENKFETFMDVTAKMYSRCSPQYMAFIFFTPLVMHLMYLVVNATGTWVAWSAGGNRSVQKPAPAELPGLRAEAAQALQEVGLLQEGPRAGDEALQEVHGLLQENGRTPKSRRREQRASREDSWWRARRDMARDGAGLRVVQLGSAAGAATMALIVILTVLLVVAAIVVTFQP